VLTVKNSDVLVHGRQHIQENYLMKIKITRPTIFRKQPVEPSDEQIEVTKLEALALISAGKAVAVKEDVVETTDKPTADIEKSIPQTDAEAKKAAKAAAAEAKKAAKAESASKKESE
jgi:hypothetical protein